MTPRALLYIPAAEAVPAPHDLDRFGWSVRAAYDLGRAQEEVESHECVVGLVSFDTSEPAKLAALQDIVSHGKHMEWIALVSKDSTLRPELAQVISQNCFDYHTVPADQERLLLSLGHAYGMAQMRRRVFATRKAQDCSEFEMVGKSPQMLHLFQAIRKIANTDAPVLIMGESGTGKELAALAIHRRSRRARGPFVAVNCGALPRPLIQSELFGHEKGSFTDAHVRTIGRIEAASQGTVFLDEIGDLPLDLQVNLLRFLQEKTIERVGSTRPIPVDVRVVAATHMDFDKAMEAGNFREDLFYRLNVLRLEIPPLREREGDVELLAQFFLNKLAGTERSCAKGFSRQALQTLKNYSWPGNVRELINRVHRAAIMGDNRLISPVDLGLERRESGVRRLMTLEQSRASADTQVISDALRRNNRNLTRAAHELGVSRMTLYRLMQRHQVLKPEPTPPSRTQATT
jgi:DNA-binding NtrC family response regulator